MDRKPLDKKAIMKFFWKKNYRYWKRIKICYNPNKLMSIRKYSWLIFFVKSQWQQRPGNLHSILLGIRKVASSITRS